MKRDVGRMGQEELRRWAAQVGIVLNASSDQDVTGWDFFLEWPHVAADSQAISLPLDRRPGAIQCLMQVKATDRRLKSWNQVRLSNWVRFVRSPLPCFFLVLEFDNRTDCQRAFLIHVDEAHIRAVLRRLRELSVSNEDVRVNHRTLSLTWDETHALRAPNGAALRHQIEAYVGDVIEQYQKRKLELVETVGYESGNKNLEALIRPPDGWDGDPSDLMLDFKLGLVSHLEVESAQVFDTRFGIQEPEPETTFEGGRLESEGVAPVGRARVRIAAPGSQRELRLDMTARAVVTSHAPDGLLHGKVRLAAPFMDLVWRPPDREVEFRIRLPDAADAQPLQDLHRPAEFIDLLSTATGNDADLEIAIRYRSEVPATGRLNRPTQLVEPLTEWANLVRWAWLVAKAVELPPELPVKVAELARSRSGLMLLAAVLKPSETRIRAEVTVDPGGLDASLPWCFPWASHVRIGDHTVQLAGGLFGRPVVIGTDSEGLPRYRLESPDVIIDVRRVYADPEVPPHSNDEIVARIIEKYAPTTNVVSLRPEE